MSKALYRSEAGTHGVPSEAGGPWLQLTSSALNLATVAMVSVADAGIEVFVHLALIDPGGPSEENLETGLITLRYTGEDAFRLVKHFAS